MIATNTVELALARVLRIGVFISAALMLFGCGLYIVAHGREPIALVTFAPERSDLGFTYTSIGGVARAALSGQSGAAWMQAGVLVLIVTPTLRVLASLFMFASRREHVYTLLALFVLTALGVGLSGGVGPHAKPIIPETLTQPEKPSLVPPAN